MNAEERLRWSGQGSLPPVRVSRRSMAPWYALLLLLIAGVGAGAWWIVSRPEPARSELPLEPAPTASVPLDQPSPEVPPPGAVAAEAEPVPAASNEPSRADEPAAPAPRVRAAARAAARTSARREPVRPPPAAADDPGQPLWTPAPMIYRTDPNRGRLVQLGAFPTRGEADQAWRAVSRRYPYLATKPRTVSPVQVRGLGGGRPTRLYRLQLGTASQAQSVVICQQLERAGQSCVVVY